MIDSPFSGNIVIKDSLNDMALELVISDLDGTILETEDYHRRAYNVLFEELGLTRRWSREDYSARLSTMGGGKFLEIISWLDQSEEDQEEVSRKLYARKTDLYVDLIVKDLRSGDLSPRPGVERLFEEILESETLLAVGSACVKWAAEKVLEASLGTTLVESLATVCAGDDVAAKKPDPAIYLLVAERCGVKPADCLVVEDTGHGMQAALGAGMKCIVTPSELARNDSFAGAMMRFENLEGVGLTRLRKMWMGEQGRVPRDGCL